jgi:hypothetical protein
MYNPNKASHHKAQVKTTFILLIPLRSKIRTFQSAPSIGFDSIQSEIYILPRSHNSYRSYLMYEEDMSSPSNQHKQPPNLFPLIFVSIPQSRPINTTSINHSTLYVLMSCAQAPQNACSQPDMPSLPTPPCFVLGCPIVFLL